MKNKILAYWEQCKKHKGIFELENKEYSNVQRVGAAAAISILLLLLIVLISHCLINVDILKGNGIWTLFALIISSPVAFIIWHFRDVNAHQQIENQRKDINLKEFQKIAEWVSGAHLVEDKIVEKTTEKETPDGDNNKQEKSTERSKEFSHPSEQTAMQTFSKRDGAVGLQIAAVYNLLPFYRGEHGEHFKKPAFNLLRTAWLSMQHRDLANPTKLKENANSPLGLALTQVLLDGNGKYLLEHKEQFKSLSLPAMDFSIAGDIDLHNVDLSGANLSMANLSGSDLSMTNLSGSDLSMTNLNSVNLSGADLVDVKLIMTQLIDANLSGANCFAANLSKGCLSCSNLSDANLSRANLNRADLSGANLNGANLSGTNLNGADLNYIDLTKANLTEANLINSHLDSKKLLYAKQITGTIIFSSYVTNEKYTDLLKEKGMILLESNNGVLIKEMYIKSRKDISISFRYNLDTVINPELTKQNNPDWEFEFITE